MSHSAGIGNQIVRAWDENWCEDGFENWCANWFEIVDQSKCPCSGEELTRYSRSGIKAYCCLSSTAAICDRDTKFRSLLHARSRSTAIEEGEAKLFFMWCRKKRKFLRELWWKIWRLINLFLNWITDLSDYRFHVDVYAKHDFFESLLWVTIDLLWFTMVYFSVLKRNKLQWIDLSHLGLL